MFRRDLRCWSEAIEKKDGRHLLNGSTVRLDALGNGGSSVLKRSGHCTGQRHGAGVRTVMRGLGRCPDLLAVTFRDQRQEVLNVGSTPDCRPSGSSSSGSSMPLRHSRMPLMMRRSCVSPLDGWKSACFAIGGSGRAGCSFGCSFAFERASKSTAQGEARARSMFNLHASRTLGYADLIAVKWVGKTRSRLKQGPQASHIEGPGKAHRTRSVVGRRYAARGTGSLAGAESCNVLVQPAIES